MQSPSLRAKDARNLPLPLASSHRISAIVHQGDAFELMQTLASESIDLLITSPPYWGHRTYEQAHNWGILQDYVDSGGSIDTPSPYEWYRQQGGVLGLEPLPEWYVCHLLEILDKVKGCLKASGSLWINIGDTYFARWSSIRENGRQGLGDQSRQRRRTPMGGYRQEKQLLLIPARFAMAMQDRRWILRNDLIWSKPNIPPRPEADRLRLAHEHFFHFVKRPTQGRAKYYYDIKHAEPGVTDVVTCCVRPGQDGHSATFPEELIRPRILSSCPPGGTVLDPFCGTGRALAVTVDTGRNAIGFEISPSFVRAARTLIASRLGGRRWRRGIVLRGLRVSRGTSSVSGLGIESILPCPTRREASPTRKRGDALFLRKPLRKSECV